MNTSFRLQSLSVLLRGDVEINPDLKRTHRASLSICHWNLNSISAHNYVKLFLLTAYLVFHKFDIICLLETYLYPSNSPDDDTLEISGYDLVRSGHPFTRKRGVCIYYKNYQPLRIISVIWPRPNWDVRFSIVKPSKLVLSWLHVSIWSRSNNYRSYLYFRVLFLMDWFLTHNAA